MRCRPLYLHDGGEDAPEWYGGASDAAQIRTCSVIEATGTIQGYRPDVILATVATNSFENPSDAKVFSGVPLLTGIGSDELMDTIVEYLKSLDE